MTLNAGPLGFCYAECHIFHRYADCPEAKNRPLLRFYKKIIFKLETLNL
jgi:hypothetical protein